MEPGTEVGTWMCPRLGAALQAAGRGSTGYGAAHGVREPQPSPGLTSPIRDALHSHPVFLEVTTMCPSWGWINGQMDLWINGQRSQSLVPCTLKRWQDTPHCSLITAFVSGSFPSPLVQRK